VDWISGKCENLEVGKRFCVKTEILKKEDNFQKNEIFYYKISETIFNLLAGF